MSRVATAVVILGLLASACFAQTATQNVSISVSEVNTIAANGAAAFAITAPGARRREAHERGDSPAADQVAPLWLHVPA